MCLDCGCARPETDRGEAAESTRIEPSVDPAERLVDGPIVNEPTDMTTDGQTYGG